MNFTFIKDLFTEEKLGKYSSKKFWGHAVMTLVCVTYVLDGWGFYEINTSLFDSMLIAGSYFLGMRAISQIFTRSDDAQKNEPKDEPK